MRPFRAGAFACAVAAQARPRTLGRRDGWRQPRGSDGVRETSETDDFELSAEGPRFWTRESLRQVVEQVLGRQHFIVVSNREPYVHRLVGEEVVCTRPVSGVVTALEPVMRVCGGSWVAHASGDADRDVADERGRLPVPPEHPPYTLRRLWLSKADEDGYYYGFANRALWPLCHIVYRRPDLRSAGLGSVPRVNRQFADAVLDEARGQPAVVFDPGLPLRAVAAPVAPSQPQPVDRAVLAHPLAQPRNFSGMPVGRADPRRAAGQRPARLPHPLPLPQLSRERRHHRRSARRLRATWRSRAAATRPSCGRSRSAWTSTK